MVLWMLFHGVAISLAIYVLILPTKHVEPWKVEYFLESRVLLFLSVGFVFFYGIAWYFGVFERTYEEVAMSYMLLSTSNRIGHTSHEVGRYNTFQGHISTFCVFSALAVLLWPRESWPRELISSYDVEVFFTVLNMISIVLLTFTVYRLRSKNQESH